MLSSESARDLALDADAINGANRAEEGDGSADRPTPLLPSNLPLVGVTRATLTVLTGMQAGQVIALDGAAVTIGRAADADLPVDDDGVSRHHARIWHTAAGGYRVEDLRSTNGTFVGAERVDLATLRGGDVLRLGPDLQVRFALVDAVAEALYRQLYESSVRDPLTRAYNRRYFADRLVAEVARARRASGDLSLLMIDVDSLKSVNDSFGHLAGDRALAAVAARVVGALRIEDVLARYGGDEFVVLAIGTGGGAAALLAERVRRAVEGLHMSARGRAVRVTASIGVASLGEVAGDDEPIAALLASADARMYGAKASGRNRVCTAWETPQAARP